MIRKKETKVKTKHQKKYNLFKISLIILILLLVIFFYFFIIDSLVGTPDFDETVITSNPDSNTFDNDNFTPNDISAPTITNFVIPPTSTSLDVPITTFIATDDFAVTGYKLTETSTAPSASAIGWSATAPTTYSFTNNGEKTLYAWVKDAAGNVSKSANSAVVIAPHFYYVAPYGNDSSKGDVNHPFFTIKGAFDNSDEPIVAGDIIYLRGGRYNYRSTDNQIIDGKNGTPTSPIMILAYPTEKPVFDYLMASLKYIDYGLIISNSNYLYIKGIRITNMIQKSTDYFGGGNYSNALGGVFITNGSSNNIIEQLEVDNIGGFGFNIKMENGVGSNNNLVLNCDSHDNSDYYSNPPYVLSKGFIDSSDGTIYRGCRAWKNSAGGFDLNANNGYITFENCWAFWNGYRPLTFISTRIGVGFKLGPSTDNNLQIIKRTLKNCLAADNSVAGFDDNQGEYGGSGSELYNCTSYMHPVGYAFNKEGITYILKNNLSYLDDIPAYEPNSKSIYTNNSWDSSVFVDAGDFRGGSIFNLDKPRKEDGSLPEVLFLHLNPKSNLINAGIPATGLDLIDAGTPITGMPYNGTAPDIGAFETQ